MFGGPKGSNSDEFLGTSHHAVSKSTDIASRKGCHMRNLVLLLTLALSGCAANGFAKFYTPQAGSEIVSTSPLFLKPPKTPALYTHSDDVKADAKRLAENGYVMIGSSSFFGPSKMANKADAIAQGEKIGAALIMVKTSYKDTLSGSVPLVLPNAPQVATVNTSGNIYGNGGSAHYNSNSTVTMPGGTTTYNMPYNVSRSDVFASYWVQYDPAKIHLGARVVPLPDDVRTRLKRNTGAFVFVVMHGTPAFAANVLAGDVIVKINDADVIDATSFPKQIAEYQDQKVNLGIIRDGQPINISTPVN
jgi:hypothetical protein